MKKFAFFLEGECELNAIRFYIQNHVPSIKVTRDTGEFVNHQETQNIALLYDCTGCENVLARAAKHSEILWNASLILVRDLEQLPCFTSLKRLVVDKIPSLSSQGTKFALFASPCLEEIYRSDPSLFQKVMTQVYRETHGEVASLPSSFLSDLAAINWANPLSSLRNFCASYNMSFHKPNVARKFFSQLNYDKSDHPYLVRMRNLINE